MNSQEEMAVQIKNVNREGQRHKLYSRWYWYERTKCVLTALMISFSVSIKALEPHDVSERP